MTRLTFILLIFLVSCKTGTDSKAITNPVDVENNKELTEAIKEDDSVSITDEFSDAVVYGDLEKVKEMISKYPDVINKGDKFGFTALHNVMCEEQTEVIKYIIGNGANVNAQNEDGTAPLHLACYKVNAELLINEGADINLQDNEGNTPLHILIGDGDDRNEVVEFLISKGADQNIKNNNGEIPSSMAR